MREIGRLCRHVTSLTASGSHVTDKGIRYLCGYLDMAVPTCHMDAVVACSSRDDIFGHQPSDVCESLRALDVSAALHVTERGIKTALLNFRNLQRLKCQDSYFWRVGSLFMRILCVSSVSVASNRF